MPVGVLFGRSDHVLDLALCNAMPYATLTQIEDGHMIGLTAPTVVAD